MIETFRSMSLQTKIFLLTGIVYIGFTVLLTVFSYVRLDYVRSGPTIEQKQ